MAEFWHNNHVYASTQQCLFLLDISHLLRGCYDLGLKVQVNRTLDWVITRELDGVPSTKLSTLYTLLNGPCYYCV